MISLPFVIWTIVWPLGCSISFYLNVKGRALAGYEQIPEKDKMVDNIINLVIWIGIAIQILYRS